MFAIPFPSWLRVPEPPSISLCDDMTELRAESVRLFAHATALSGLALFAYVGLIGGIEAALVAMGAALLILAVTVSRAVSHNVTAAAVLLVAGLLSTFGFAQWWYPRSLIICGTCLVVLLAVHALGGLAALGAASAATLLTLVVGPPHMVTATTIALLWAVAYLAWIGTHSFRTAVAWSQRSSEQAHARTDEARSRQAELARLSRNLRQALVQLERTNEELERARIAANEARQRKVEFATTVSHELRTPLNLVIGFAEMMVLSPHTYGDTALPDVYRGDIEAIYRNACHLSNLIDDVLDLSQIDARRMALQLTQFEVQEVIGEAMAAVGGLFVDKAVGLSIDCPPSLPPLIADRTRIRQVLINLLANAVRFTEHGEVKITGRSVDCDFEVSVIDTGPGMQIVDQQSIFTDFYRIGSSPERHTSGLGLAICKRLVELHGGRIWVESRAGSGSTFTFSLPLVSSRDGSMASYETWASIQDRSQRPTLAVVTDDPDILRLLRRYLPRYDVMPVRSLVDGLEQARLRRVQALFVTTAQDIVRASELTDSTDGDPGLPVISCAIETTQEFGRALGAAAYVTKPVTRESLHHALGALERSIQNILIVDDDPEVVRLLTRMVQAESPEYDVWRADSGRAALLLLETQLPDVILLDLLMPDLDGYAVLHRLRADATLCHIPVVIVSAKGSSPDRPIANQFCVTRRGGLPMVDVMRCLQMSLDLLLDVPASGSDPGSPAVAVG